MTSPLKLIFYSDFSAEESGFLLKQKPALELPTLAHCTFLKYNHVKWRLVGKFVFFIFAKTTGRRNAVVIFFGGLLTSYFRQK